MTLAPLLDASTAIQAHAFAATAVFALGVVQQDGLSCQSHAKSASRPLRRLRSAASPLSGIVPMYVLMSVGHLVPWLRLISHRRSGAHQS
jgi:hypothetical protein